MWAAVIGDPIAHSLSPVLHGAAYRQLGLDWHYRKCLVPPPQLGGFLQTALRDADLAGLSVTMPHKQTVIPYLQYLDPVAQETGVVNTVLPAGRGYNTDVAGIVGCFPEGGTAAVILGSGATASSALIALSQLGIKKISVCARTLTGRNKAGDVAKRNGIKITGTDLSTESVRTQVSESDIIISTLPVGVADYLAKIVGADSTGKQLLDVAYAAGQSDLVKAFRGRVIPGTEMLLRQAREQVRLMTGRRIALTIMRQALQ
ncbi:MAG: shikimate dehydrogenase [Actinomycetaceae bacterium]|nr:shikimate dehydrogenase [Actinomycetaceae bacterium]